MTEIENKNRGWQRLLLFILPYIFIVGSFQLIGGLITGFDTTNTDITNPDLNQTSLQRLSMFFFGMLGTFLVIWVFISLLQLSMFL